MNKLFFQNLYRISTCLKIPAPLAGFQTSRKLLRKTAHTHKSACSHRNREEEKTLPTSHSLSHCCNQRESIRQDARISYSTIPTNEEKSEKKLRRNGDPTQHARLDRAPPPPNRFEARWSAILSHSLRATKSSLQWPLGEYSIKNTPVLNNDIAGRIYQCDQLGIKNFVISKIRPLKKSNQTENQKVRRIIGVIVAVRVSFNHRNWNDYVCYWLVRRRGSRRRCCNVDSWDDRSIPHFPVLKQKILR